MKNISDMKSLLIPKFPTSFVNKFITSPLKTEEITQSETNRINYLGTPGILSPVSKDNLQSFDFKRNKSQDTKKTTINGQINLFNPKSEKLKMFSAKNVKPNNGVIPPNKRKEIDHKRILSNPNTKKQVLSNPLFKNIASKYRTSQSIKTLNHNSNKGLYEVTNIPQKKNNNKQVNFNFNSNDTPLVQVKTKINNQKIIFKNYYCQTEAFASENPFDNRKTLLTQNYASNTIKNNLKEINNNSNFNYFNKTGDYSINNITATINMSLKEKENPKTEFIRNKYRGLLDEFFRE